MMDKDSKLIFEKYKNFFKEEFSFDESETASVVSNKPEESTFFKFIKEPINRVLTRVRDPKSVLTFINDLSNQLSPNATNIIKAWMAIANFIDEGKTGNAIYSVKDFCQKSTDESKKSVDSIIRIIENAKNANKTIEEASPYLNLEGLKIKQYLTAILNQNETLNEIYNKEFERNKPRTELPERPDLNKYIEQFSTYLVEKGISVQPSNNIEKIMNDIEKYINKTFSTTIPITQSPTSQASDQTQATSEKPNAIQWK